MGERHRSGSLYNVLRFSLRPKVRVSVSEFIIAWRFDMHGATMVLKLTSAFMEGLEERSVEAWSERAAQKLIEEYSEHFTRLGVAAIDLEPMCLEVQRWAGRFDQTGERDLLRLCLISLSLGYRFWQDPRFRPLVDVTIANTNITSSRRVDNLASSCEKWLTGMWGREGVVEFHLRLVQAINSEEPVTSQAIYRLIPSHWELFSNQQNQHFIEILLKASHGMGLERDNQKLSYIACAFAYGFNWYSDPQYKRLSQIIDKATETSKLADDISKVFAVSEDG